MQTLNIDTEKIVKEAISAISDRIGNLNTLNIIIAGKTGVGKSTLINAVFREKLAETGMGKPVTSHIRKIVKSGLPLCIYDTKGFELGKDVQNDVKKEILDTINEGLATKDINKAVHCIWYCINTASNRIEPKEIEWLKALTADNKSTQVPIIVVLTQSISKKKAEELRNILVEENLDIIQVVPVLAEDYEIEGLGTAKAYGLDKLIRVMAETLPEELQDTLQNVQIASLEEKKRRAHAAVVAATATAAGAAAIPIPLADATMLVPTQIGMIASITAIFGMEVNKSVITALLSSTVGTSGATWLGKTIFSSLTKLIPGAGSVVGGVISATTASTITAALGEAYIAVLEMVYKNELSLNELSSPKGKEIMSKKFMDIVNINADRIKKDEENK